MSSSRTRHHRFLFAAAPLLAFLVWLPLAPARADVHRQCTAILDPDTVAVQTEPVIVGYAVPDSIGLITAVTPAEDSGIVSGRIDAEAQTVAIQTSTASQGDWAITFLDDAGHTCIGTLTVASIRR